MKSRSIEKWQESFNQDPLDALDRLLTGRVYMGILSGNDPDEILFRLFSRETEDRLIVLDQSIKEWFVKYWGTTPSSISTSRWNESLRDAFSTVKRLNLKEVREWLLENYQQSQKWLQSLYLDPGSDPEADLRYALGLSLGLSKKDR